MKVLVTGANGLIGSNLIRELILKGYEVTALVRHSSNLQSIKKLKINLIIGDILDFDSLIKASKNCEFIFHTVSIFTLQSKVNAKHDLIALKGTENIIKAAQHNEVRRVILTSSSVVFGSNKSALIHDENNEITDFDEPPYIFTKKNQQDVAFNYANELGVEMVSVCPTMVLGPHVYSLGPSSSIIISYLNDLTRATYQGGCNIVSSLDVAKGHIIAAENGINNETYIIGSENLNWEEIHNTISELCGVEAPLWTCNYTAGYVASGFHELIRSISKKPILTSRGQAKMIGKYYWYTHKKAEQIGYSPISSHDALALAISWLSESEHITRRMRISMTLSDRVYQAKEKLMSYENLF